MLPDSILQIFVLFRARSGVPYADLKDRQNHMSRSNRLAQIYKGNQK